MRIACLGTILVLSALVLSSCDVEHKRAGSATQPSAAPPPPGIKGYREVFYATDRAAAAGGSFGPDASDKDQLQFGRVVVSIPEAHSRGELERPWQVFSVSLPEDARRHIIIAKRTALPEDAFFTGLTGAIDDAPESGTFVFVHGFNVSFDDAVLRTAQLAWDMKFRGPALTYSWPSAGATAKYVSDLDMADWTAPPRRIFEGLAETDGHSHSPPGGP